MNHQALTWLIFAGFLAVAALAVLFFSRHVRMARSQVQKSRARDSLPVPGPDGEPVSRLIHQQCNTTSDPKAQSERAGPVSTGDTEAGGELPERVKNQASLPIERRRMEEEAMIHWLEDTVPTSDRKKVPNSGEPNTSGPGTREAAEQEHAVGAETVDGDTGEDPVPAGIAPERCSTARVEADKPSELETEGGRKLSEPLFKADAICKAEPLIKAEVVIGENTRQVMLESNFTLMVPAIKVREIQARVMNVTAQVIPNKIIIQGIVHKQIFFVDLNNRVMHQGEDVPFSTFIDVPGAGTNMNVQVRPVVEHVGFILTSPTVLHQKIVLEIFVKVTETRQIHVVTGAGPLIMVEQVVSENTRQSLEQNQVVLTRPAIKVSDITATLRNVTTELLEDKVVIQGIVHKQIFFVGTDNIQYHQAEDVEFSTFVDLPGAMPGMNVELRAEVEHIGFELLSQTVLLQQIVLQFFVKVTETVQLNLALGGGPLLKVEEVRGENVTQTLVENELVLSRPAIKIREIIAQVRDVSAEAILGKVIVQGIVHKQIFFIGTDNLEYHQAEDVPFSFFVDIPGAAADRNIHVRPFIEHISFQLLDELTLHQKVVLETFVKVTETVQVRVAEVIVAPYVSPYVPYVSPYAPCGPSL